MNDTVSERRKDQLFPVLNPAQIETARRFAVGNPHRFAPGETVFALGERNAPAFILVAGSIDVHRRDGAGHDRQIHLHGAGEIAGEISQLAGRAALAEGKAGPEGCEALAFDAAHLRALIIGAAEIGEIIMRAFILRRTALILEGGAGSVLVGRAGDPAILRMEGFLTRNGYPYSVMDIATDPDGPVILSRLGLSDAELPIVLCPNGAVLKRPTDAEVGACLGITPDIDPNAIYDVAIVGAGPAGLATAVYAASEGLSVIVFDSRAFGGQAGASARIENYLGFPTGISGQALAARAFVQAQKFGAEVAIPITVEALERPAGPDAPFRLALSGGGGAQARSVVIASGARYRRPAIDNLGLFEGAGVSYWASPVEARLCRNEDVALVGAGNSAGQAVVYLAPIVRHLHLVVRGEGLEASMSSYLIERIRALPNVTLHTRTEIASLIGEPGDLRAAVFRDRAADVLTERPLRHVFLFIGADPHTEWLEGCAIARDDKGFVVTGPALGSAWTLDGRAPQPLETSMPGVFAIGDVRAGSAKRVAGAVGEGAQAVAGLHVHLAP